MDDFSSAIKWNLLSGRCRGLRFPREAGRTKLATNHKSNFSYPPSPTPTPNAALTKNEELIRLRAKTRAATRRTTLLLPQIPRRGLEEGVAFEYKKIWVGGATHASHGYKNASNKVVVAVNNSNRISNKAVFRSFSGKRRSSSYVSIRTPPVARRSIVTFRTLSEIYASPSSSAVALQQTDHLRPTQEEPFPLKPGTSDIHRYILGFAMHAINDVSDSESGSDSRNRPCHVAYVYDKIQL